MRLPSADALLTTWEAGAGESWTTRAVLLVQLVHPELTTAEVLSLPIGDRDARMFRTRKRLFGPRLDCTSDCPECGATLQTSLLVDDVLGSGEESGGEPAVQVAEHGVTFRLPTSADLFRLEENPDPGEAERRLLQACILTASAGGEAVDPGDLPPAVFEAVSARMAEVDPCADVRLDLECPTCRHRWEAPFDVVSHVWYEIEAWARFVLRDVHTLARAYGWREQDILAMSQSRRRAYLDLVDA